MDAATKLYRGEQRVARTHDERVEEELADRFDGYHDAARPRGRHGSRLMRALAPASAPKVTNHAVGDPQLLSTIPDPDISISVYPDSDKVAVWPPGKRLRMTESLDYWDGEL